MFLDNDGTLVLSTLTPPVSSATDGVTNGGDRRVPVTPFKALCAGRAY